MRFHVTATLKLIFSLHIYSKFSEKRGNITYLDFNSVIVEHNIFGIETLNLDIQIKQGREGRKRKRQLKIWWKSCFFSGTSVKDSAREKKCEKEEIDEVVLCFASYRYSLSRNKTRSRKILFITRRKSSVKVNEWNKPLKKIFNRFGRFLVFVFLVFANGLRYRDNFFGNMFQRSSKRIPLKIN